MRRITSRPVIRLPADAVAFRPVRTGRAAHRGGRAQGTPASASAGAYFATMAARILITMDDLETAVPLNAAAESAGLATAMLSSMDDARAALRRQNPDL